MIRRDLKWGDKCKFSELPIMSVFSYRDATVLKTSPMPLSALHCYNVILADTGKEDSMTGNTEVVFHSMFNPDANLEVILAITAYNVVRDNFKDKDDDECHALANKIVDSVVKDATASIFEKVAELLREEASQ